MKFLSLFFALILLAVLASPVFAADDAKARGLLNSLGCKGCHSFEGSGGTLGPALDGVGKRLSKEQIKSKMLDPKATNPASMMPTYGHLATEDLEALIDFFADQK
jgi:mono/diheme cytochrome c family protein